ncbi:odorant receptor Or2-like [Musca vetustissima]|uniref:odorant receptor Or2-like n=1 Tax=Musca vetustissima TaxID=27455 RepID=UPI002AB618C2|nr:odorant receptor Or2-like [Musca vetustissima]
MYYNHPLFSFNIKMWKLLGFIEFERIDRAIVILIFPCFINTCQFMNIAYNLHDMSVIAIGLFMTAILFNALVRILTVMKNQSKFIEFFEMIENWYHEIEMGSDAGAWNLLKHVPRRTRLISIVSFSFAAGAAGASAMIPLFLEERCLPYDIYVPKCDHLKSPVYEILYFMESCISMPFCLLTYVPFTNLFITWLTFGIRLLQILRHKLESLPHENDEEMLKQLKELIRFHHRIMDFGKTLESLVSFVCLVELVLFTLMLCVLLASFLLMDNVMLKMAICIYIFCILYALFIPYWHANEFSWESTKIADAAYNINWTRSNTKIRKCIAILMLRSQTPIKIKAGGIFPMTLEAFQALLNTTYTYFTMFKGMMGKEHPMLNK